MTPSRTACTFAFVTSLLTTGAVEGCSSSGIQGAPDATAGNTGTAGSSIPDGGGTAGTSSTMPDGSWSDVAEHDTLPEGWVGAQALQIQQSNCPAGGPFPPSFDIGEAGMATTGTVTCTEFRLGQALCAYVTDDGPKTKVLIQPCELYPSTVPKGDQFFNVTFTLPKRSERTTVELYERFDYLGEPEPFLPRLIATAVVGVQKDGGSSTD
jgi:hypothetical protein